MLFYLPPFLQMYFIIAPDWARMFPSGVTRNGIWPSGGLPAKINSKKSSFFFKKNNVSVLPANLGSNNNNYYAQAMGANHLTPLGGRGVITTYLYRGAPSQGGNPTLLYTIFDKKRYPLLGRKSFHVTVICWSSKVIGGDCPLPEGRP